MGTSAPPSIESGIFRTPASRKSNRLCIEATTGQCIDRQLCFEPIRARPVSPAAARKLQKSFPIVRYRIPFREDNLFVHRRVISKYFLNSSQLQNQERFVPEGGKKLAIYKFGIHNYRFCMPIRLPDYSSDTDHLTRDNGPHVSPCAGPAVWSQNAGAKNQRGGKGGKQ